MLSTAQFTLQFCSASASTYLHCPCLTPKPVAANCGLHRVYSPMLPIAPAIVRQPAARRIVGRAYHPQRTDSGVCLDTRKTRHTAGFMVAWWWSP